MKKSRKKSRKKSHYTVAHLYNDIIEDSDPKASVYVNIGGPMLKVKDTCFYESGINGKPTFLISLEGKK